MKTKRSPLSVFSFALLIFGILACQTATVAPTPDEFRYPTETAITMPTEASPAAQGSTATPPALAETAIATEVPPANERALEDRPDDFPGKYQVHVLYVLPAGAEDQERDSDGRIQIAVQFVNAWFAQQSGGSTVRFDTFQGQLDITFVALDMTSDEIYEASVAQYGAAYWIRDIVEAQIAAMNVFQPGKIYVSMVEIDRHISTCADSAHPPELMGRMAGLYPSAVVEAGWNCADQPLGMEISFTDMGVMHEVVHLLGFASACGSHPTSGDNTSHTGDDNRDLMWAPAGGDARFWETDNMLLDPGNDDYYNHSIAGCPDLIDSAFLEPVPADAQTPTGWPDDWKLP